MSFKPSLFTHKPWLVRSIADIVVYRNREEAVAIDGITKEVIASSDKHERVLQKVFDEIAKKGGVCVLWDNFEVYSDLRIKLLSYKPVVLIGRHYYLSGISGPGAFRKLIIDGSEITNPGKSRNCLSICNLSLGLGMVTENMDGKAWSMNMEQVYASASLHGSSGYGIDLKNAYGTIRDSFISYGSMNEPGGTFRLSYDTGDADTHIENTMFIMEPMEDGIGEIIRIEAPYGGGPTNIKLVDVHTGGVGSGANRARYALYLRKLSRFVGRNLYLEGYADKQIVLDSVINSVIHAQSPLKVLSINSSSKNVVIADFDIEVETDNTDQRNVYIIRQAVPWTIFWPSVGVNNTYGPPFIRNFTSSGYAPPQRLVGATIILKNVASGEILTVKIETVDCFNNVRSIEKTFTASGTYKLNANDLEPLINPWGAIREIRVYVKSNQQSSSASVIVHIYD